MEIKIFKHRFIFKYQNVINKKLNASNRTSKND